VISPPRNQYHLRDIGKNVLYEFLIFINIPAGNCIDGVPVAALNN
jgi:hypothetical protein